MKKIISFLTSAVMAAGCIGGGLSGLTDKINLVTEPLTAEAEAYGDYLYYNTVDEDEDGTYDYVEITDCDTSAVSVDIPSEIDGLPVTSIGSSAFYNCRSLASITIPDSVTSIGNDAFVDCTSLKSVNIPDTVTSVGAYAFNCCSYLESVYISDITAWCNIEFENPPSNPLYYADNLYLNNELVTDIDIPDGVTDIPCGAFSCTSLESITIPDSVTSIKHNAFKECTSLTGITIGNSVTSIGDYAFSLCTSLESITIPDSVIRMGITAFWGCTSLESITIGNSVTSIENGAFKDCTSLAGITIPYSVTSIGDGAFEGCTSLADITIENPDCTIYDSEYTISDTATIYGYENSTAQTYAENYNRKFVSLGKRPAGLKGDVNGDGEISVADVVLIQKCLVRVDVEADFYVLDVNSDDKFNVFDAISLKRIVMNT